MTLGVLITLVTRRRFWRVFNFRCTFLQPKFICAENHFEICLFGSFGCEFHFTQRTKNKIDLKVVLEHIFISNEKATSEIGTCQRCHRADNCCIINVSFLCFSCSLDDTEHEIRLEFWIWLWLGYRTTSGWSILHLEFTYFARMPQVVRGCKQQRTKAGIANLPYWLQITNYEY
jgi:hypothetical protein